VVLASDPRVHAEGTVREIAPTVNADNGTIRVKIGLANVTPQMTLGAVVFVSDRVGTAKGFAVPWNALSKLGHRPAVWIADPRSKSVSLQPVVLARYEASRVILKGGLKPGQLVVTAGSQQLHPGQIVTAAEEADQ
jgi:multidrug efflux pump subunit AcrA (membrane-fusion protein)